MDARKYDYPPLLAPGRHFLRLPDLVRLFVSPFEGQAYGKREYLYHIFESLIQELLRLQIRCEVRMDGSFLTEKPQPDDIDAIICLDQDVADELNSEQDELITRINTSVLHPDLDCFAWVNYRRESDNFGRGLDADSASEGYGLEHGQHYLKGYVVLRLWETDVGLRIRR